MVVHLPDLLSQQGCQSLRLWLLNEAPWARGVSAGPQALAVKRNLQVPEGAAGLNSARDAVLAALSQSAEFFSAVLPSRILPPHFNRYTTEDSHYGLHVDGSIRRLGDQGYLRTDVSATLFLSDPADYDGGELVVHDTYGSHEIKLTLGSLVVYPSGSLHEVRPVVRGERLAAYFFIQSLVPDLEHRRLLYELDRTLRSLRGDLGETDGRAVQLTGHYHNLLRRWSAV